AALGQERLKIVAVQAEARPDDEREHPGGEAHVEAVGDDATDKAGCLGLERLGARVGGEAGVELLDHPARFGRAHGGLAELRRLLLLLLLRRGSRRLIAWLLRR